jgi:hypothetical protein
MSAVLLMLTVGESLKDADVPMQNPDIKTEMLTIEETMPIL